MRVLVCGGRDFNDRDFLFAVLDHLWHSAPRSPFPTRAFPLCRARALYRARTWAIVDYLATLRRNSLPIP